MVEDTGAKPLLQGYSTRDLFGHKRRVCTLSWSGNGRKLASGSADSSIRIWAVEPHGQVGRAERTETELKGHAGSISQIAWKPGNQNDVLASTTAGQGSDKAVRLWDVRANKCTSVVSTPSYNLFISWCPDGSSLAVVSNDNTLQIIDARKGKVMKTHKFPTDIYEIHWGPTAGHLMAATDRGSVDVMTFPNMDVQWSLRGHTATCYCFSTATINGRKYLASGGGDALISLWDLEDVVVSRTWSHMDHPVRSISLSHDGRFLAYSSEQGELEVLSTLGGERLAELRLRTVFSDYVEWNPVHPVLAYCDEAQDPNVRDRAMIGVVSIYAPPKQ